MNKEHALEIALKAAKVANELILANFGKKNKFEIKPDDKGVVTEIDEKAEEIIREIIEKESDHSILGEEKGWKNGNDEYLWVIDPIDGTSNFLSGIPFMATSIAMMKGNELVLGVIGNPITGDIYHAVEGERAFKNDKLIKVREKTPRSSIVLSCYGYPKEHRIRYGKMASQIAVDYSLREYGSAALSLCFVAEGKADAFLSSGDELWDYAAGLIIAKEAGAVISDWNGKAWDNSNNYILAARKEIHPDIVSKVDSLQV